MRMPYIADKDTFDRAFIKMIVDENRHDFEALVRANTPFGHPVGYVMNRYLLEVFPFAVSFNVRMKFGSGGLKGIYGHASALGRAAARKSEDVMKEVLDEG